MKNERIRPQDDTTLFWLALAASVLGLVFILDAGYAQSAKIGAGLLPRAFFTQIFMLGASILGFFVIRKVKSDKLQKLSPWVMGFGFVSLMLVEVIGVSQNGAKRWLGTQSISIQPAA